VSHNHDFSVSQFANTNIPKKNKILLSPDNVIRYCLAEKKYKYTALVRQRALLNKMC